MAVLANVALTNTFDTWRLRTNALLHRVNQYTIDESALYAPTLTANVRFVSSGSTRLGTTGSNRTIINGLTSANGNLNVAGNTTISGILNVNGGINLGDATTDLLTITGRASVGTNLSIGGNTSITRHLTVTGNTNVGKLVAGNVATYSLSTIGPLTAEGRASISTNLEVYGNTTLGGASKRLTFGGAGAIANVTGWFGVTGRQSISTNLFVGGNVEIRSASSRVFLPASGSAANPSLTFFGDPDTGISRVAGNNLEIEAGGVAVVNIVPASVTITGALAVSGNTTLNGTTTDRSNALSQTLTDGATINWDVNNGRVATVTIGASRTFGAPTNLKVGTYILSVIQGGSGSYGITWNSVFKWTAGVAPVLTTTVGARDLFTFYSDGTNLYGSYLPDVR